MIHVYTVNHVNPKNRDEKDIGTYSSYEEALATVEKYKSFKGFRDSPEGFYIDKYELNKLHWAGGYYSVKVKVKLKDILKGYLEDRALARIKSSIKP